LGQPTSSFSGTRHPVRRPTGWSRTTTRSTRMSRFPPPWCPSRPALVWVGCRSRCSSAWWSRAGPAAGGRSLLAANGPDKWPVCPGSLVESAPGGCGW
jgi:hypothetical protein